MKISPWILGAAVLVPAAGAVAGTQMSTDPIAVGSDVTDTIPHRASITHADATVRTRPRLPNHYAMETPDGRVEVHELAMRGRYKDRYRELEYADYSYEDDLVALEAQWDERAVEARAARALDQGRTAPAERESSDSQQPLQIAHYAAMQQARTGEAAAEPAQEIADGVIEIEPVKPDVSGPKVIDVRAELALRD